ncbi:MAG: sugar ABC transporter substrate-binding protein [Phycisphaerae bacterium]
MRRPLYWIIAAGLFVLGGVLGYTVPRGSAGGGASAGAAEPRKWNTESKAVAYVLPNDGPYYDLKWKGVSSELERLGYEPQKYAAAGYKNIKTQTDILENLIQKKVAGIILHAVSDTAVVPFVERAYEAGIPVIAENVEIASDKVAGRVMLANYQNGWELAMALTQAVHGRGKIAALVGPPGLETTDEMWRGAKDYFTRFPGIQIVREEYLQANTPEALERMQSILSAHDDLAGIYTWYIQNGIGAAEAVRQAKLPPDRIPIVAKDTNPQGEQLLKDGYLTALLVGEPISMGRASARLLDAILKGESGERYVLMRNRLVDRDSLQAIDRSGFE